MAEKKLLSILFPSWRKVTCLEDRMWDIEIDLDDENSYFQILGMIAHDQSLGSSNGKVRFFVISEAATRDIIDIQRQTSSQQLLTNLHFLQFEASRVPLIQAVNSGELHIAHDWIHNAFDDCVSRDIARKFHAGRVFDIFTSNSKCIVMNRMDSFRDFFGAFYYYCSARDALFEVAEQLQVFALRTIRNVEILNQQYIWTVSAITSWICQYNQPAASDLTAMIEYLVSRQEVPRRAAANLAIVLNGPASRFANGGARAWGKWLLENVRGELNSHQILNAYSSVIYTKEEYDLARDDILNACSRTHDELMTSGRSPISTLLVIDQRANTLSPYAYKLHKFGIGSDFIEILSRWYGIQPSKRLEGGTLVVLPSHSEGMAYIASQPIMFIDNNRDKSIEEAVISTNNALQISLNISGQRTPISEPVRQGQPNYENGADFEETLNRFYGFDKLQREELLKCTSMISFPGYPHPIQSMMRKEVGWAVPISASLKQPEPDRRVSKICVWYAGDDFYSKMEAEAVKSVFAKHSIQCDRYSGSDDSSASIREVYERVDYDVIWICGHGHYDHWDPSSPMIQVGTHSRFGAEDVSSWDVPGLGRRLLVLNVCDGGVAAVLGGIHKLGMAPMLASENQATVSHLWPVEPRVASAFGVLFANNLATQADLFNAFAKTLDEIRQPWSEISQFISEICPGELADRLRNCDHDMTNVFNFGSPVFFS